MSTGLTSELVDWAASVRWQHLPASVRDATQCRLIDSLSLMLAGSTTPAGSAIRAVAEHNGGRPESGVVGTADRLPAPLAALVHGTWAHVHDFDDTEPDTVIHPTSPVVAAALAVGEASASTEHEVLSAITVGVEVMCRLGVPAGRGFHHRGFHATAVVGPLAVALTSSLLMNASREETISAMGLAGSMSGGLLAFLSDGSWSKRLHPGWAAHGGVLAAQMAVRGFRGPAPILEDRYGVYRAFLQDEEVDMMAAVRGLGDGWRSVPVHLKRYPCAHVIEPFLDAVLAADLDRADIESVVLRLPPWQVPIVCEPWDTKVQPATEYQARTSLPFAVASSLVDGRVGIDTFDAVMPVRADVGAVLARMRYEADDTLSGFEARVEVVSRTHGTRSLVPPSMTESLPDVVRHKLRHTVGPVLAPEQLDVLLAAVDDAEAGRLVDPLGLRTALGPTYEVDPHAS